MHHNTPSVHPPQATQTQQSVHPQQPSQATQPTTSQVTLPKAIPQALPIAIPVLEATSYATTFYCRHCGRAYVPRPNTRYTAQFFRCGNCTDNTVLARAVMNSCVVMWYDMMWYKTVFTWTKTSAHANDDRTRSHGAFWFLVLVWEVWLLFLCRLPAYPRGFRCTHL